MAKSKYDPETFPALAEGYAREGLIDKEIAAKLGVSEDSFYEYLKRHSEFSESIKRGKAPVDFAVEGALLRLALGGNQTETTRVNCSGRLVVSKEVTREVLPDVAAAIFWLRNRRPDKWRGPRGDGDPGEPPGGAKEDAEHPQCPAEGWPPAAPAAPPLLLGGNAPEPGEATRTSSLTMAIGGATTNGPASLGGAGEGCAASARPAGGWSPPPATEADAAGGKASFPERDAPATTFPERDAPATSFPERDAPATSFPERDAPATSFPERDAPATSLPERDAPATSFPERDAPATSKAEQDGPGAAVRNDSPTSDNPQTPVRGCALNFILGHSMLDAVDMGTEWQYG